MAAGAYRSRLELRGESGGRAGRVSSVVSPTPTCRLLDGAADVWAMCCRDRWFGLEQEGFGIVFLEAAATGVAQLAGRSGGSDEAVVDGQTGLVVDRPQDSRGRGGWAREAARRSRASARLGNQARRRAVTEFDYDKLARRLHEALVQVSG